MSTTEPRLSGSLDVTCAETLRDRAAEIGASAIGDVTIDCAEVERIDGAAAQVLLALARVLAKRGHRLTLHGLPERPATLLQRAGFAALLGAAHPKNDTAEQEVERG